MPHPVLIQQGHIPDGSTSLCSFNTGPDPFIVYKVTTGHLTTRYRFSYLHKQFYSKLLLQSKLYSTVT